ncbi:hypothetical protein Q1695_001999 [Nippostrongylus brasiliensis]|nr:hypothetical protein Q1695_001999 [Nippostrongylus brasiliensis]
MLSQLSMMEEDMRNANAAMAGELYPLAQQKVGTVIHEGRDIAAKEVLTYEEQALVRQRCDELEQKLRLLEELARERQQSTQISQELANLQTWYAMRVVPFLATHADMGGTLNEAVDFLESHQTFVEEVVNRDASVTSALSKQSEMTVVERKKMQEFETLYERLKDVLEHRIRVGSSFVQVHKFAKDLESSFDALISLLDTNRDFTNDRVAGQVENVFRMIEETMAQEKHDVEKFVVTAEQVARNDDTLDVTRSVQAARNVIVDHEHRYTYAKVKWSDWLSNKESIRKVVSVIEEVEMWQEETWEIIRLLENTRTTNLQDSEGLYRRVKELQQTIDQQSAKLDETRKSTKSEEITKRIDELIRRQQEIRERAAHLEKKVETVYESFLQQEIEERIRAPQILTSLKDAQVEEGSRFEFVARIEGEPEPKISWLKDGIDVKSNIDYRQDFVNGVASLVIEETFIEDTATYTVRAENEGGVAESSAKLTVKSRSAVSSSIMEDEKPRFVKHLVDVQVTEGETSTLDCVVVGRPEPEVVWYKEEKTVQEDERVHLKFVGDHVSLTITPSVVTDTGLYTVKARNVHGEATNFCQLKVVPKKLPPPTPPKPRPARAPMFQQSLTTTTWDEGDTATLQVVTYGEPRPEVHWRFEEQPIYKSETIKTEDYLDGTSRLIISPITTEHRGTYTAVAVNEAGEAHTSATVDVIEKKTVDEHMLQEDMYERISRRPAETTQKSEKRWTEQIDEILEQRAPSIVEDRETKTAETYVKMVDELMRDTVPQAVREASHTVSTQEFAQFHEARPQPQPQTTTTEHVSTEVYSAGTIQEAVAAPKVETTTTEKVITELYSAGQYHEARPPPKVETTTTEHVTTEVYNIGKYFEAVPEAEVKRDTATTTTKAETVYAAAIQPAPTKTPERHMATSTSEIVEREHAATIRQTPVPETHKSTVTSGVSVENIATIRETPAPEVHRTTFTKEKSVERLAAIRQTPVRETHKATVSTAASVENVAAIRQTPVPETHKATMSTAASVENVAAIREVAVPESHKATTTAPAGLENIGTIRQSPARETHKPSLTRGASVENAMAIRESPAPDLYRAHTTRGTSVERAAAIREAEKPESGQATVTTLERPVENVGAIREVEKPESGQATVTSAEHPVGNIGTIRQTSPVTPLASTKSTGVMKENVAQVNMPTAEPEKRQFTKVSTPIGRIDDIVVPERRPKTTAEVSQTITEDARVHHVEEHFTPTQITTTERIITGGVGVMRDEEMAKEEQKVVEHVEEESLIEKKKRLLLEQLEQEERELLERIPKPSKQVTQTTEAEGWVQHVHDDLAQPQTVQTTKRYEKEVVEGRQAQGMTGQAPATVTTVTTRKTEDEEAARRMAQSRIPQLTKRVTTTTTADGFVQHVHDELTQPVQQVSTTTRSEDEDAQWQRMVQTRRMQPTKEETKSTTTTTTSHIQMGMSQPFETVEKVDVTTKQQEVDESRYRDSFIAASEGEGFWTDGAYTTSPSPPPVPRHRFLEEETGRREAIEIGMATTEPEFIRPFRREYTVDEGGRIVIESTLVGNPRPKVRFFFNDKEIRKESTFCETLIVDDTYSIVIDHARLEHAGFYKITAENKRGITETLTMLHVRPQSLVQHQQRQNGFMQPSQKVTEYRSPTEHTTVTEEFAMFEYEQRRPQKHETSRLVTPPPAKRFQSHRKEEENLEQYDFEQQKAAGHPPHFTQTLVSAVAADGESARFEGIVTGWPAPSVEWTKDGVPFTRASLPDVDISNIGGRVSLFFKKCSTVHSGKYMCTARNASGVATSSAQLVIRPKTIAPDFIQRLISEEVTEGEQLKWTVKVTGDPMPKVTWLRDGIEIPNCEEVRLLDEGNGVHSLVIVRTETADSGQFTCLAENLAGEARSTADLVVRPRGTHPGSYFHITKVTQEKQVEGEQPIRNTAFTIENPPLQSAML